MPVGTAADGSQQLIRRIHVVRGKLAFHLECRPGFDYARATHQLQLTEHGARFDGPAFSLALTSPVPLQRSGDGVVADFTLGEGERATFVLFGVDPGEPPRPCPARKRRRICSAGPSNTGGAGCRSVRTGAVGAKGSSAPP